MAGYSQLGQDEFVLGVLGYQRNGFFLDSGASDGVTGSNTYLLERDFSWRGICVEPDSQFFQRLVQNRQVTCICCCLYDSEDDVAFVEAGPLGGVLADYHPNLLALAQRVWAIPTDPEGNISTVAKPARTVGSVLQELNAPPVIDYWSLDTEGSELRILKSFPFDRYRVRVMSVEHNRYPVRAEIRWFLESRGYVLVRDFGIDDCYVEASLVPSRAWRRRRRRAVPS